MKTQLMTILLVTAALGLGTATAFAGGCNHAGRGWGPGQGQGMGQGMGQGGGMMQQRFGTIDENNDGVISDDEAAAQVESVFAAMDADDNGELTMDEYMAVRMGPGKGLNPDRQKLMQDKKQARFGAMDTDKSGTVSQAEFVAGGKARFAAADTDKDGKVTPWEFRALRWQ
jgi:hypothetical protein